MRRWRAYVGRRGLQLAVLITCLQLATLAQVSRAQPQRDAQQFRNVSGSEREDVPGVPLLLGAYALFALCVSSYVWRLAALQRRSRQRLARLDAALDQATLRR